MYIHNHRHKRTKQCTGDLICHIYNEIVFLSYINKLQAPDKMTRPQKDLSKRVPTDHHCPFAIHKRPD